MRSCACLAAGVSAGQLQKLQGELAQLAALAGQMALSAGWWQLATLLQTLSASAQAGASKDLLPLLQVRPLLLCPLLFNFLANSACRGIREDQICVVRCEARPLLQVKSMSLCPASSLQDSNGDRKTTGMFGVL